MKALGSPRITPWALALLAAACVLVLKRDVASAPWLAAPLLLLALNLAAAVATDARFRRQLPLLVFHLALAALGLLAGASRLYYLNGTVELVEGAPFAGLDTVDAGPWHRGRPDRVGFVHEGFDIAYMAGPVLDRNIAHVRWQDASGAQLSAAIEANRPLVQHGYRFYPTANKGFAALLGWQGTGRAPLEAALHLPSYPANALAQARTWRPAGSADDLWIMLKTTETLIAADRPSRFRLPASQVIVVRRGAQRWELAPGQRLALPDGVLDYRGLSTWMGYKVSYDWTMPWLLAACCVAILAMGWHFWRKFAGAPWNSN